MKESWGVQFRDKVRAAVTGTDMKAGSRRVHGVKKPVVVVVVVVGRRGEAEKACERQGPLQTQI